MFFLLSGEGPTDLGSCNVPDTINESKNFQHGPLTIVVDRIIKQKYSYSIIEYNTLAFVPRQMLISKAKKLRPVKLMLPSEKRKVETGFFFKNARALACIALEYESNIGEEVVGILFRDADKSDNRGSRSAKRQSMLAGFAIEQYSRGVPMLPQPISECWFLSLCPFIVVLLDSVTIL